MTAISNPYAERQSFEKTKSEIEFPDLLSVQVDAFQAFIQENVPEDERLKVGLEEVFSNYFPIEDSHRNYVLEYKNYFLGLAKYTRSEEHTSELQSQAYLVCRLLLEKKNILKNKYPLIVSMTPIHRHAMTPAPTWLSHSPTSQTLCDAH